MLVPLAENTPPIDFNNDIEEVTSIAQMKAPSSVWSSIIYHMYLSCLVRYTGYDHKVTVNSRCMTKKGKKIFLISTSTRESCNGIDEEAKRHLNLAQELASRYELDVFSLPVADGEIPIALCWPENGFKIQGAVANQKFSTSSKIASRSRLSSASSSSE